MQPMTKTEVAELLGIDRSRVYQLEKRALKKIREALLRDGVVEAYLELLETPRRVAEMETI